MKKIITLILAALVLPACTSVKYNGSDTFIREIDHPEVGKAVTVYVGDHMLQKGTLTEENVLVVRKMIDGAFYDIPARKYQQIGYDNTNDFYTARGVVRGGLADPIEALALGKKQGSELCVITTFGGSACYKGDYARRTQLSERGNSFQQILIYSGRVGDKINIGYREFSNNTARPAFNNDVEYDLSLSKEIGYKGAVIEVIKANNSSITYKVVRNFP